MTMEITPPPKPEPPPKAIADQMHDASDIIRALVAEHAALVAELAPHSLSGESSLATLKRLLSRPL